MSMFTCHDCDAIVDSDADGCFVCPDDDTELICENCDMRRETARMGGVLDPEDRE